MILGLSTAAFTLLHVAISIVGIVAGLVVVAGMLRDRFSVGWNALFLVATIATSATGFFFHSVAFGPPHVVGVISLVILAAAAFALYVRGLAGVWRTVYVASAVCAFYLNAFVGVVQAFQKLPPLQALAPTQSEPPFLAAQLVTLAIFVAAGVAAWRRFRLAAASV